ncbi:MAG TPA: L-histidine N(alpha)-methyltransferase, partial [Polyangiaceae bacterium]|nr:L-histidine N(alpha)-methyltransferase [Polyangiaceae bacterium]
MGSVALDASIDEWQLIEGEGFSLRLDRERQGPLAFAMSVAQGLDSRPRCLDASYLYDATGSALFERITEQPEYYLTRAEDRLLVAHAEQIRALVGPSVLVELGSGASAKTERLLDAWLAAGATTYVPVDVDAQAIERASGALHARYRDRKLNVFGIAATYERALALLGGSEPITIALLGSTLGNLGWHEYPEFCQLVADTLRPGDHFLVGLDLVKDPARIEAAYNDRAGVTAAFTRNLFTRMNRELESEVPEALIEHVAYYDSGRERVEIFAEARAEFTLRIPVLDREFRVARGERIQTEVSHKFRPEAFVALVERFGLRSTWQGLGDGDFGLFLLRKPRGPTRVAPAPTREAEQLALLDAARARTLELIAPLGEADLTSQPNPLMSPLVWDLGHIAQYEAEWLAPELAREPGAADATLYDPIATPRAERSQLELPPVPDVLARLRRVRKAVRERLARAPSERAPLPAGEFSLQLVLQHELQHQETMLQALALRADFPYRPSFVRTAPAAAASQSPAERLLIPAGSFLMGTNDRRWAYDNERPAH